MRILILTIGDKMPAWVADGYQEYAKRFQNMPDFQLEIKEIPAQRRTKSSDLAKIIETESEALLNNVPKGYTVMALDVLGKAYSSEHLAGEIEKLRDTGQNLALLIGGPEGFSEALRQQVGRKWSLSALTLAHPVVRVVLAEALYRAVTIIKNHPYHRA